MGVARERNRLGLLLRTGTWWASFEIDRERLVPILDRPLDRGFAGLGGDATASGRLSWLERGGHRLKPIPKAGIVFKSSLILSDKSLRIISPLSHTS
ncbi:hypothetical protein [Lapidilactobacillus salsurivasis]